MTNFRAILQILQDAGVEFILVGGLAAGAHGSPRATLDVDVVYRRTGDNMARLVSALQNHSPYPRGAPPGLPFHFDVRTLQRGLNFTLTTDLGDLDLLGEITGGGTFDELLAQTQTLEAVGLSCLCLTLEKLIEVKRAAGRPKDFEAIAELEVVLEERQAMDEGH